MQLEQLKLTLIKIQLRPNNIIFNYSKPSGKILEILNESEAPTRILYVAKKPKYKITRKRFQIGNTPLDQTHIIYLDRIAHNDDEVMDENMHDILVQTERSKFVCTNNKFVCTKL